MYGLFFLYLLRQLACIVRHFLVQPQLLIYFDQEHPSPDQVFLFRLFVERMYQYLWGDSPESLHGFGVDFRGGSGPHLFVVGGPAEQIESQVFQRMNLRCY